MSLSIGRVLLNLALGIGMFLLLWVALADNLESEIVPHPGAILERLQENERMQQRVTEELPDHFKVSAWRIIKGIAISTGLALPLGLLLGQSQWLNRLFSPLLGLIYVIPKVVFLPVTVVYFGFGDASKVALIVLVLFFQILVIVRDEALNIPPELLESVRSLGAGRRALYRYVYIPASFGAVLTAWRVSVGTAVAVLFIAETTVTRAGLGYYIMDTYQRLRYEEMYIGILAMSGLGMGLYLITDILERLFRRGKTT